MVALMTGQPRSGKIGQQDWCAGSASIDQILLARSPLLGGAASTRKTMVGSLQVAADIRSDRDEIAPRVLSYLDALPNESDISRARQPLYPDLQPIAVFNRLFGGGLPPGTDTGPAAGAEAERARFHAQGSGAHANADSGDGEGPSRRARGRHPESWSRRFAPR
jgi:hypothetical protein